MRKKLLYALPCVVALGLVLLFLFGLGQDPNHLPSALVGRPVPDFSLPELEEKSKEKSKEDQPRRVDRALLLQLAAKGPVLVNFFASWCIPCQAEHPVLQKIARDESIPILGIAWKNKPSDARAWLKRWGNLYEIVGLDQDNRAGLEFGVYGVPETYLVDAHGRILHRHAGPLLPAIWEESFLPKLTRLRREREREK